jgi:hypothetical protein
MSWQAWRMLSLDRSGKTRESRLELGCFQPVWDQLLLGTFVSDSRCAGTCARRKSTRSPPGIVGGHSLTGSAGQVHAPERGLQD